MSTSTLISIVIPLFNEEDNVHALYEELSEVCDALPYDFEVLVVDNCSTDQTGPMLKKICSMDQRWKYLRFSRTFPVESSLAAGYRLASGDAIMVLFADLQEPPSLIPQFIQKWQQGYDVVYGVHTDRGGDHLLSNWLVKLAYRAINWSSEGSIPPDVSDFRLISRRVRDALQEIDERCRYTRGIVAWLGFKQIGIPYRRAARRAGRSKSNLGIQFAYFANGMTTYSMKPLRFFLLLGMVTFAIAAVGLLCLVLLFLCGVKLSGSVAILTVLIALIGMNSFGIGLLGEYIGRVHLESKGRPLYIVEEVANLDGNSGRHFYLEAPSRLSGMSDSLHEDHVLAER